MQMAPVNLVLEKKCEERERDPIQMAGGAKDINLNGASPSYLEPLHQGHV
jgi:hypothetical protein